MSGGEITSWPDSVKSSSGEDRYGTRSRREEEEEEEGRVEKAVGVYGRPYFSIARYRADGGEERRGGESGTERSGSDLC